MTPAQSAPSANSEPPGTTSRKKASRDPWLDNAKVLLVTLVVVGHTWPLLPGSLERSVVYDYLYLWHIPAFVLVTGYLSKSFTWSAKNLRRLVQTLAVPYVIFEGALAAFRTYVGGENLNNLFIDPHWPMWYLSVLFLWRLVTPLLRRPALALPLSVAISLLGGLYDGNVLDVSRAMGLLPFFVLGLSLERRHLEIVRDSPRARRAALGVFVLVAASPVVFSVLSTQWLYWRSGYSELGAPFWQGALIRALLLPAAGIAAVAFFALVPRHDSWITRLGPSTLVVYLFHGFFIRSIGYAGLPDWLTAYPAVGLLVMSTVGVGIALLLGAPPVASRLAAFVDPVGWATRAFARPASPGARGDQPPGAPHQATTGPGGLRDPSGGPPPASGPGGPTQPGAPGP